MNTKLQTQIKAIPTSFFAPVQSGFLQRKCACGGTPGPTGECEACRKKRLQRKTRHSEFGTRDGSSVPSIVYEALRSPGQPLDTETRAFMEPRFGHDFSRVRVHTGGTAAKSAAAVNALAYTVGESVVFADGEYAPKSHGGLKLLAHELAHVIQQEGITKGPSAQLRVGDQSDGAESEADTAAHRVLAPNHGPLQLGREATPPTLRRLCGPSAIGTPAGCAVPPDYGHFVAGRIYRFNSECDTFAPGEETRMWSDVRALPSGSRMAIHGFASVDGPATFNHNLACARAQAAQESLTRPGPLGGGVQGGAIMGLLNHGPTSGPVADRRSVVLVVTTPTTPITPPTTPPITPPITPPTTPPPIVKPGPHTPCERQCLFDFLDCTNRSRSGPSCLIQQSICFARCVGAPSAFEVCVRLLQPPVQVSGCNHAYIETPTKRYAIITPCTSQLSFATPFGGVAIKTDRSPDPCKRRPTCIECVPRPGVSDLESCFAAQFTAYAAPSLHMILGPNSNTFAGTLARACCANMNPKPAAFGCLPGWDDPPAPPRSEECPTGPPLC